MAKAARVGDPVGHTMAMPGLIAGLAVGLALAAVTVATFGAGAVIVGAALAGGAASGALTGAYIGEAQPGPPTGTLITGSPNVFINGAPAAITVVSVAPCLKEYGAPMPVAQGASTILINGQHAARVGDKLTCGAKILSGSTNVDFTDETATVLPIEPEVPPWLTQTLEVVALGAAVVGFGAAIAAVGVGAALCGLGAGLVGGQYGAKGGRALGEALGLSEAGIRALEAAGGFLGGMASGAAVAKGTQLLQRGMNKLTGAPSAGHEPGGPKSQGRNANGDVTPGTKKVCTNGCPISMHTGEELLTREDWVWPGPVGFVWQRFYRTAETGRDRQLGHGWVTLLDEWIELQEDGSLAYHDHEGRIIPLPLPEPGGRRYQAVEELRVTRQADRLDIEPSDGLRRSFSLGPGRRPVEAWHHGQGPQITAIRGAGGLVHALQASWGDAVLIQREGHRIAALLPASHGQDGYQPTGPAWVRYQYDAQGDLVAARDRLDQGESYAYRSHVVVKRTLASGFSFHFEWDQHTPAGRCVRNWGDREVHDFRFEWLEDGLSRAIDSRGGVTSYVYNEDGQLLRLESAEGVVSHFRYNEQGLLVEQTNPLGTEALYAYDSLGRLLRVTDAEGHTQHLAYDGEGRLAELRDPMGQAWRWESDRDGRLLAAIDPQGQAQRFRYNEMGLLSEVIHPDGSLRQLWWDEQARLVADRLPSGMQRRFQHDAERRITAIVLQDQRVIRYQHDAVGRVVGVKGVDGREVQLRYDAMGNLTHFRDAGGQLTQYRYDDGLPEPSHRIDPLGRVLRYHYDRERNLVGLTNAKGEHYQMRHDLDERLVEQVGFDGRVQRFRYDVAGRLHEHAEALDPTLPGVQAQPGETLSWRVTRLERDRLGRLVRKHLPDGQVHHFQHDPLGRLVQARSAEAEVAWRWDALGRLLSERQAHGELQHAYDAMGRRVRTLLPDGQVLDYQWSAQGQLQQVLLNGQLLSRHRWDEWGQEVARLQGDVVSQYQYDEAGRLVQHAAGLKGQAGKLLARRYVHDAQGRVQAVDDLRHGPTRYVYDPADQLMAVEGLQPERFVHDPAGNLCPLDAQGQPLATQVQGDRLLMQGDRHFQYDSAGNLVHIRERRGGQRQTRLSYDVQNRLVAVQTPEGLSQYRYDPLGRRISKITPQGQTHFVWDGDRLVGERRWVSGGEGAEGVRASAAASASAWDAAAASTQTEAHAWIATEQRWYVYEPGSFRPMAMLQVQEGRSGLSSVPAVGAGYPAPGQTQGLGQGLGQGQAQDPTSSSGAWQQFLHGGLPAAQAAAANDAQPGFGNDPRAADGAQAWAASHRGRTQVYHYQLDHLGTPRELTTGDGRIVWSAQYRVWGQLALADVQEIDNPIRFQGQYHDLETGLHYNFQRYYDPSLGRYIHQDPIGLAGGGEPLSVRAESGGVGGSVGVGEEVPGRNF